MCDLLVQTAPQTVRGKDSLLLMATKKLEWRRLLDPFGTEATLPPMRGKESVKLKP